jgi:hypothetical protein
LYTYGRDHEHLEENCKLLSISFPFETSRVYSLKEIFAKAGIKTADYDSGFIVEAFGQKLTRRPHNALNDVRTLLDGLRALSRKFEV